MVFTILSQFYKKVNRVEYVKVPNSEPKFYIICTKKIRFYIFWSNCFCFNLLLFHLVPLCSEHFSFAVHRMGHARKECCDLNRYRSCSYPRMQGTCMPSARPMPRECIPEAPMLTGAPLAMAYVPVQTWGETYSPDRALCRGTLFPALDLPFERGGCCR